MVSFCDFLGERQRAYSSWLWLVARARCGPTGRPAETKGSGETHWRSHQQRASKAPKAESQRLLMAGLLLHLTPRAPSYQLISSLCNGPRKWVKSRSDSLIWHFFGPQPPSGFWFWFSFSSHSHSFLLSPLLLESTDDRVLFVLVFSFIFA